MRPFQLVSETITCGSMPENYYTVAMRLGKCYILDMSENTAYEQKDLNMEDLNMVVMEPIHNPWIEMSLNAKAYFEAYRGQCRLRIDYASLQEKKAWSRTDWEPHEKCKKNAEFWVRSGEYWKRKLEESFRREKDYLEGK